MKQTGEITTVYHYCSVETFYEIISGKMLRLSDIDKSNDYFGNRAGGIRQKAV